MSTQTVQALDILEAPSAGDWKLDLSHTRIGFSAKHLMVSRVRGSFERFEGVIHVGSDPFDSSVDVSIETNSIVTGDRKRDEHLASGDFLESETYPAMKFTTTKVEETALPKFKLYGDLTIKDVTRPVVLDAEYMGKTLDPWGGERVGFTARGEIDREEFGMTWNVLIESGGVLVGRKVEIELDVQGVRQ